MSSSWIGMDKLYKVVLPILIFFLNLGLKIIYLDAGSISGDEPFTIFYSQQKLADLFELFRNENNPPLHFLILHFWIKCFGISAFSTRFPSLIFSSLTAVYLFKLGKQFFNLRVAVLGTLLFTFSSFHFYFAHETRVYALFALLTVLSMYAFLNARESKRFGAYFTLLVLSNTLLIYAHFFGFFIIVIQALGVLLISDYRKHFFKAYSYSVVLVFLTYIPYLKIFLGRFLASSGGTWVAAPKWESLYNLLWKFSNAPVNTSIFLLLLITAGVAFAIRMKMGIKKRHAATKLLTLWFFFPFLFIFLISFLLPMFLDRYLIFISVAFYMLLAISLESLINSKKVYAIVGGGLVLMMILTCNYQNAPDGDLEEAVRYLKTKKDDNTVILLCPPWLNHGFSYHLYSNIFKDYRNFEEGLAQKNVLALYTAQDIDVAMLTNASKLIFVAGWTELVDPQNSIKSHLDQHFHLEEVNQDFKVLTISEYSVNQ
ncbi:glycosyltransferase family 39 protein [Luteibaculum oceani]|uniref:Glycosyltransferase RgtA/B/C/D-like domain-containing protein n=1 Tax=Luteibaculum oceani TaxID=1294296 RepID=A0A5C6V9U5_9FLAO|nr:glycosyltransferase family 39 protein [Luteibaculum oceani]TXC81947.1 hypothetical protein FRX97_02315 [Luteibaculum oceani]